MTTPESLVVSLDLARKLQEAGYPQDSTIFQWKESNMQTWLILRDEVRDELFDPRCFENLCETANMKRYFAAPTAEEILRRLPGCLFVKEGEASVPEMAYYPTLIPPHFTVGYKKVVLGPGQGTWCVHKETMMCWEDASLANAAAQMWVYLKEHGLLPSEP